MPSKRKKYNAKFPPARIKKIMQTDEEVGKVAAAVPVVISRALELFIESLITKCNELAVATNAKTLTTSHIKRVVEGEKMFDFLRGTVAAVPELGTQPQEDDKAENQTKAKAPRCSGRVRQANTKRHDDSDEDEDSDATSDEGSGSDGTASALSNDGADSSEAGSKSTGRQPGVH